MNNQNPKYYMVVIRRANGCNTIIGKYDTYEEAEKSRDLRDGDAYVGYGTHTDYINAK